MPPHVLDAQRTLLGAGVADYIDYFGDGGGFRRAGSAGRRLTRKRQL